MIQKQTHICNYLSVSLLIHLQSFLKNNIKSTDYTVKLHVQSIFYTVFTLHYGNRILIYINLQVQICCLKILMYIYIYIHFLLLLLADDGTSLGRNCSLFNKPIHKIVLVVNGYFLSVWLTYQRWFSILTFLI
jgi:hypothetical protein